MSTTRTHDELLELLNEVVGARQTQQSAAVAELESLAHFAAGYRADDEVELAAPEVLRECRVRLGGAGTPLVSEFAALEVGAVLRVSEAACRSMFADALDLTHRLPHTLGAARNHRLPVWVARKVATLTRDLNHDRAGWFDARFARQLGGLPPARQLTLAEALVIEADTAAATQRELQAQQSRYLTLRPGRPGTAHLEGQLDLLDAHLFDAATDRIADIIAGTHDYGFNKTRLRATAVGILANPARALTLLHTASQPALDDPCPGVSSPSTHLPLPEPRLADQPAVSCAEFADALACHEPPTSSEPEFTADPFDSFRTVSQAIRQGFHREPAWRWASDSRDPQTSSPPTSNAPASSPPTSNAPASSPPASNTPACCHATPDPVSPPLPDDRWPALNQLTPAALNRLLPRATLVVHISHDTATAVDGVARVEGHGPVSFEALIAQLDHSVVTIRPVIDLNEIQGVDRYEIPWRVRDLVLNRDLYDPWPGSQASARTCDLDHLQPWQRAGANAGSTSPPQTRPDNLMPTSRRLHRAKTKGLITVQQTNPGQLSWHTPLGLSHHWQRGASPWPIGSPHSVLP